jgi:hypothetical protein
VEGRNGKEGKMEGTERKGRGEAGENGERPGPPNICDGLTPLLFHQRKSHRKKLRVA